jgi:osmotically inducible protein OsmC
MSATFCLLATAGHVRVTGFRRDFIVRLDRGLRRGVSGPSKPWSRKLAGDKERLTVRIDYRTPTVTSIGGRDGSVRSADGLIDLQVAIPKEMGGPGGKTNPEELFAAGYAACFHSAVKIVAADRKVAIGKSTVEAHVGIGPNDNGPGRKLAAELHAILPGADAEAAKDVVRGAHLRCPYSNATRNNIDVKLSVTPADGNNYDVV